jgi:integrase
VHTYPGLAHYRLMASPISEDNPQGQARPYLSGLAMRRKKHRRSKHGDGGITWNAREGRYVAQTSLGFDDAGNRIRRRLVGPRGDKSEDAYYGLKDRLEQLQRKAPPRKRGQRSSRMTLGEYLNGWLESRGLSDAGRASYAWAVDNYLIPRLANRRLYALERRELRAFFSSLNNLGPASKEKIRTVLRKALQDALDDDLITSNPAMKLDIRTRDDHKSKETLAWSKAEAQAFLRVIERSEHLPMLLVMVRGALGPAETFGLQWRDLDRDSGWVSVVRNLTEVRGRLSAPKDLKEKSRRRGFRIPKPALEALRQRYKERRPAPTDYIFTAPDGAPIRLSNFRHRVWTPLLKKAGVRPITVYGLRHSAASIMAAIGIPLLLASRTLGHADIKLTANVYSHLFEDAQEAVDEKFDAFFEETFAENRVA